MKKILLLCAIAVLPSCSSLNGAINKYAANQKVSLVPFEVKFNNLNDVDAKILFAPNQSQLNSDLVDVKKDWMENKCADNVSKSADVQNRCLSKSFENWEIAQAIGVARDDLNRDGKPDLILQLGGETGRSGLGACGTSEYRFYENIGKDFRPIGQLRLLNSQTIWAIDDAHYKKGEFQTIKIVAKADCDGKPIKSEDNYRYDYAKKQYFDLKMGQ